MNSGRFTVYMYYIIAYTGRQGASLSNKDKLSYYIIKCYVILIILIRLTV